MISYFSRSHYIRLLRNLKQNLVFRAFKLHWAYVAKKYRARKDWSRPRLMFGTIPIINNKYWNEALKNSGYDSTTVMNHYFPSLNKKEDFDIYAEEILEKNYTWARKSFKEKYRELFMFDYCLKNYDVFHLSFLGITRETLPWKSFEPFWIKHFGGKIIIIPYGADFLQYSLIRDFSYQHALMAHYPSFTASEENISKNITIWKKYADIIIGSLVLDGKPKWDLLPFCNLCIDLKEWKLTERRSMNNGTEGEVTVVHSPNHRIVKGTDFVIQAVNKLKSEGLKINFILIEKMPNSKVKEILQTEADILVEQLLLGYALNGIEGMASGIPVISNLENEYYHRVYRRYSYLNECPVFSATPETITDKLRILVTNPALRSQLGHAGRKYVEKYHSYSSALYMFKKIYENLFEGKNNDLMNLYNPLNPASYNNTLPLVEHPLKESKLQLETDGNSTYRKRTAFET